MLLAVWCHETRTLLVHFHDTAINHVLMTPICNLAFQPPWGKVMIAKHFQGTRRNFKQLTLMLSIILVLNIKKPPPLEVWLYMKTCTQWSSCNWPFGHDLRQLHKTDGRRFPTTYPSWLAKAGDNWKPRATGGLNPWQQYPESLAWNHHAWEALQRFPTPQPWTAWMQPIRGMTGRHGHRHWTTLYCLPLHSTADMVVILPSYQHWLHLQQPTPLVLQLFQPRHNMACLHQWLLSQHIPWHECMGHLVAWHTHELSLDLPLPEWTACHRNVPWLESTLPNPQTSQSFE